MDKDRQAENAKSRLGKGERKAKNAANYLRQTAKSKNLYLTEGTDP
jgi:hypothetical protein